MSKAILVEGITNFGFERFKIKILKDPTINPEKVKFKYRTRPAYGLSSVIIGTNVSYETAEYFVNQYLSNDGRINALTTRLLK